ncbi:hypothetical protein SK803_07265 [Lentzea sp. BCCO 10_0856]|uniref:PASTA domain-containing protein n=1 Tax=Lentzea miocenica TaxID=3095431 RepID=A0ABU4SVR6_9PSEU|nr:hypothetical protein [Lentzea sp. BCCO 10_0856]MDX8030005.1 hypothetical protein [Lentzea sp. BCCO 10_0856]
MSEQEIREGMLLAVWDEPPLDFDPDTLMRRVEQKKSRRRALVTVGVATAMIVVASLALPGLLPRGQDGQLASDGPTTSSAPPSESADKKAQRIGDKLTEKLGVTMTNVKEVYADLRPGQVLYPPIATTTSTQKRSPSDPEMSGYVFLTDEIGPTALRVVVVKRDYDQGGFCTGANTCQDVKQKDGSLVTAAEFYDGTTSIARAEVLRRLDSGLLVRISSYNTNPATGLGLRQTVPVPVGVLTQLVTDPSISWE